MQKSPSSQDRTRLSYIVDLIEHELPGLPDYQQVQSQQQQEQRAQR